MKKLLPCAAILLLVCGNLASQEDEVVLLKNIRDAAADVFVTVEIKLAGRDESNHGRAPSWAKELYEKDIPLVIPGIVVEDGRRVVIPDPNLLLSDYGEITVRTLAGEEYAAVLESFIEKAPGLVLKLEILVDAVPPKPAHFVKSEPLRFGDSYYVAGISRDDEGGFYLAVGGGKVQRTFDSAKTDYYIAGPQGSLVCDERGKMTGFKLTDGTWSCENGYTTWDGKKILASERIPVWLMQKAVENCEKKIAEACVKIEIEYREDEEDRYSYRESAPKEIYGYLIDKSGSVFVPKNISARNVKRIEEIVHKTKDGGRLVGQFVGLFKGFGGFIVKFAPEAAEVGTDKEPEEKEKNGEPAGEKSETPSVSPLLATHKPLNFSDAEDLSVGRFCVAASPYEKGGELKVDVSLRRISGAEKVRKEKENPKPESREDRGIIYSTSPYINEGYILLDEKGRALGFRSTIKIGPVSGDEHDDYDYDYEYRRDYGFYSVPRLTQRPQDEARIFLFSAVAPMLHEPQEFIDKEAMPVTKKEGKHVVWLGVEFQGLNQDLAEALDVAAKTEDGRKGLLVILVYPGSPAEKLGIKKGDILLEVIPEGKKDQKKEFRYDSHDYEFRMRYESFQLWRDRRNYLTRLLTKIGKNKEVELKYLSGGEEKTAKFELELSPPDSETANKFKDEILGLTVKDMTYEVRAFSKLGPDEAAVIVDKSESGRPMQVALYTQRFPLPEKFLIRKINGIAIKDVKHYEELMEGFKNEKAESLTFLVELLGYSKFIEVKPDWDETADEAAMEKPEKPPRP